MNLTHTATVKRAGFTLIELSIVLVIIGLLIGGVLVGQDLINTSEIRAQLSQIEKYNTAANTFKVKYGYLPGDIPDPTASGFGFVARGIYDGEGNGDGFIEGIDSNAASRDCGGFPLSGEAGVFWRDLSSANLIDATLITAISTGGTHLTSASVPLYLPKAKIGDNYISVGSGFCKAWPALVTRTISGKNIFAISIVQNSIGGGDSDALAGLSVQQAYNIDSKVDDGLPQSGNVVAQYWANGPFGAQFYWAGTAKIPGAPTSPYTTATPAADDTCFDNGNVIGTQKYSTSTNDGSGINCALSFKMQ